MSITPDPKKVSAHKPSIHSIYIPRELFNPIDIAKAVKKIAKELKNYEFEAFAFRGMSGALIAPLLAVACKKTLLMVRKPMRQENCHSESCVEGDRNTRRYIIVDDFISSGATCREIVENIHKLLIPEAICIGALMYTDVVRHNIKPKLQSVACHFAKGSQIGSDPMYIASDPETYRIKNAKK